MTRDEFIDAYIARSGIPREARTPDGFVVSNTAARRALPCDCGEPQREGWAMVSADLAQD